MLKIRHVLLQILKKIYFYDRLSRKQLPIVDVNGNVKYSTPSGDIEMNWLEKGSGTPSPQSASLGNYNNKNNRLRSNSAAIIPSTGKCNFPTSADIRLVGGDKRSYWNSNSRNYFSDVEQKQQEQRSSPENESDWSQISNRVSFYFNSLYMKLNPICLPFKCTYFLHKFAYFNFFFELVIRCKCAKTKIALIKYKK